MQLKTIDFDAVGDCANMLLNRIDALCIEDVEAQWQVALNFIAKRRDAIQSVGYDASPLTVWYDSLVQLTSAEVMADVRRVFDEFNSR